MSFLKDLFEIFLDILFPKFCVICEKDGEFLCNKHFQNIKKYNGQIKLDLAEVYLDEARALFYYESPISDLIQACKYGSVRGVIDFLLQIYDGNLELDDYDVISFVPMTKMRQSDRGFNQSQVLAKNLAGKFNLKLISLFIKNKQSRAQAKCETRAERLSNLQNKFSLDQNINLENIAEQKVLLVDDVLTTGSTLNELAKILKKNGVCKVDALVLAHGD